MDNATRRILLQRHKASGFPGSIIDVYKAYDQGVDLIGQYQQQQMQQQPQVAQTPQERQEGLRPAHQAGNTNQSMVFPNTEPNASFNTVGMKAPIDIKQYDNTGNLVASYDKVPPGITDLKMSSQGGTVLETPAQMKSGGIRKFQSGEVLQSDNTRVNTPKPQTTPTLNPPRFEPKSQGTITQAPYDSSDFWRAVKDHNLQDDSTFENTVEAFEPTGVSSWDDAYRAYNSMQNRGAMLPNADEALDMFGAIPFLGKAKFAFNLAKKAQKPLAYYGMQFYNNFGRHVINNINRADALEDETGFLDQKKSGGVRKYQSAGLPTYADSTNVANFARAAQDFYNDPNNGYTITKSYSPEYYARLNRNLNWPDFVGKLHEATGVYNNLPSYSFNTDLEKINRSYNTNITADAFIRDVSNPYQVSPPDVLSGYYNSFFNPHAPDPIFDSRILPEEMIVYNSTKDQSDVPSYDPIMVTPWQDLTEDEKKERVDKGIRTGNTGGIPQQVLQTTGIQNKNPYTGSNTKLFIDAPFEMPSLPPSQIPTEALEERSLIPIMRAKSRGREPQTIYKQDPRVSTGQYPVGERIWDYDLNRWKTDMWDEDMIRSSRELALPRREKWRTIETPPGGFKNGGVRKAQNGLPPLTLGQTSPDWRATGPGLRIDGQTYQNSQLTGATRVPLNPETGDQLPIMLPTAEIVGNGGVAAGTGIGLLGDDMQKPPTTYNRGGGVRKYFK